MMVWEGMGTHLQSHILQQGKEALRMADSRDGMHSLAVKVGGMRDDIRLLQIVEAVAQQLHAVLAGGGRASMYDHGLH